MLGSLIFAGIASVLIFGWSLIDYTDKYGRPHHAHSVLWALAFSSAFFIVAVLVLSARRLLSRSSDNERVQKI